VVRKNLELWVGCIAGALEESEYREKLAKAGFEAIDLEVTRAYGIEDARAFLTAKGIDVNTVAAQVDGKIVGAFIRARKPAEICCGGNCPCNA
jgi:stage V sporulation protein SpoVS